LFYRYIFNISFVCALVVLTGCADQNVDDLRDFVAAAKARPGKKIDPIPTYPPYKTYTYQVMAMRPPFSKPVKVKPVSQDQMSLTNVKPDKNRTKEFLEGYSIDSLKMVGTLSLKGVLSALIQDRTGSVHPVSEGNYIGKKHGKVVDVSGSQMDVVEIISNGQGAWVERPRILKLRESK
jgi:type IV pilus assembly protein PilP